MKKFSEFAEEHQPLEGDKVKIDDLLNTEIAIKNYDLKKSRYDKNTSGKYLTLQFSYIEKPEVNYVVFTGSEVIISQIEKYAEHIPFQATIKKINRYYTLS